MLKKLYLNFMLIFVFVISGCMAQEKLLYKQIDTTKLVMQVVRPPNMDEAKKYPAMIFFFGGGWTGGTIKQFEHHAAYFSKRGIVCFLADYRVASRQQTSPFESLKDAKSALRYLRMNAEKLQIDPDQIIAAGGSAGGHLAAATAVIEEFNETTDDVSVSAIPNALVLYNPVIDNGPAGFGYERIGDAYKDFSPLHNIKEGAPPTLFFLGTKDKLIPVTTAEYYQTAMEKVGSRCDLHLYVGEAHGFFNYAQLDNYKKTVATTDRFLQSLSYLNKDPKIVIE